MSRRIGQPVNQVRLTNVAMVRMHKGGKRFEIACYRNKVLSWRQGAETDIDEVLQTHAIFLNVSKGVLASAKDLQDAFGNDDEEALVRYILEKGEYHPSDKEREAMLESTYRDIATIVIEKSVNPASNRPYTLNMVLNGMKEIHFAVNPTRSAKQQALEVIRRLKEVMPIERAKMHLRALCGPEDLDTVLQGLKQLGIDPKASAAPGGGGGGGEQQQGEGGAGVVGGKRLQLDMLVDPGLFRQVDEAVRVSTGVRASLQVLDLNMQQEGEAEVDSEIARKEELLRRQRREEEERRRVEEAAEKEGRMEAVVAALGGGGEGEGEGSDDDVGEEAEGGLLGKREGTGNKKSKAAKRREKEEKRERDLRRQQEAERRQAKQQQAQHGEEQQSSQQQQSMEGGGKRLACNTCRADFADAKQYREHYRTDWHRYNLKLKEKGGAPVGEKEFELCDADELFFANSSSR